MRLDTGSYPSNLAWGSVGYLDLCPRRVSPVPCPKSTVFVMEKERKQECVFRGARSIFTCFAIGNTVNVFKRLTERGHFG